MKINLPLTFTLVVLSTVLSFAQSNLISQFDFSGNLNDNLSNGTCTSYNNSVTSFAAGSFNWTSDSNDAGGGLKVTLPDAIFTENHYSVMIDFRFSETAGYRKFLDFTNRTSDQGAYINYQLRLYSFGGYGSTTINPDSNITVLITRDSTDDSTHLYLWNGVNMILESFGVDASQDYVSPLNVADRTIHFFADDSLTLSEYSLSGSVNQIKIWNGIVSAFDITGVNEPHVTAFNVYPNPSSQKIVVNFNETASGVLSIYSVQGKVVYSTELVNQLNKQVDVSHLPSGIYFIRYNNGSFKFIKE